MNAWNSFFRNGVQVESMPESSFWMLYFPTLNKWGGIEKFMISYLPPLTVFFFCFLFFYQWDPSSTTLMEEMCRPQEETCWKIRFIWSYSKSILVSQEMFRLTLVKWILKTFWFNHFDIFQTQVYSFFSFAENSQQLYWRYSLIFPLTYHNLIFIYFRFRCSITFYSDSLIVFFLMVASVWIIRNIWNHITKLFMLRIVTWSYNFSIKYYH